MTKRSPTWMLAVAVLAVCGCSARGDAELLQSRLRQQENRLLALESELEKSRHELTVARRQTQALESRLAARGEKPFLPEQAETFHRAAGIEINRLFTGGLDHDGLPGDDLLAALVVPLDEEGELVKVPGSIQLELFDLTQAGDRQRIGTWNFDVEESRGHWHQGFFKSGYLFQLPWQDIPQSSTLLLHARLTTTDGRQFDTNETIRVTPPSGAHQTAKEQRTRKH